MLAMPKLIKEWKKVSLLFTHGVFGACILTRCIGWKEKLEEVPQINDFFPCSTYEASMALDAVHISCIIMYKKRIKQLPKLFAHVILRLVAHTDHTCHYYDGVSMTFTVTLDKCLQHLTGFCIAYHFSHDHFGCTS